jgi:hypothetical protein
MQVRTQQRILQKFDNLQNSIKRFHYVMVVGTGTMPWENIIIYTIKFPFTFATELMVVAPTTITLC